MRPSQRWAELLQDPRYGKNLVLHLLLQRVELRPELVGDLKDPSHPQSMA